MAVQPVKIYSTPTCPYCAMAKSFFASMKIPVTELDVSRDEEAAHEMMHKSGQIGVPVIEIRNTIIVGFDRPTVLRVLEQEGVIRKKTKQPEEAAAKPAAKAPKAGKTTPAAGKTTKGAAKTAPGATKKAPAGKTKQATGSRRTP